MKIIFIIIDGLGDESIPALGGQTPLEAAKTSNLDRLAQNGICGLVLPYCQKIKEPSSEDTHLALFGYRPQRSNPGRGVLELLGLKVRILPGDVCLRGNFATLDRNFKIIDRRAGRIKNTEPLIQALKGIKVKGIKILVKKGLSHRLGIILRGKNLSEKITDGDIKKINISPPKIKAKTKEAKFTAIVLNEFLEKAHLILKEHPLNKKRKRQGKLEANYILVRGAGKLRKIEKFEKKYGLRPCCIAGAPLYKGIAEYLGMELITVKGATGLPSTNLAGKFKACLLALKKPAPHRTCSGAGYDFVFCHIKAADNFAEDGNFLGKKEFIKKIDKNIKSLLGLKDTLIVVTGDHSTCSLKKSHCKKPLPLLIWGADRDRVKKFSERDCQKGKLGKIRQLDLMPKVLKIAGA